MTAAAVIPNTTTLARLPSSAPRPGRDGVLFRVLSAALERGQRINRLDSGWSSFWTQFQSDVACEILFCEGHPRTFPSWCPGNPKKRRPRQELRHGCERALDFCAPSAPTHYLLHISRVVRPPNILMPLHKDWLPGPDSNQRPFD